MASSYGSDASKVSLRDSYLGLCKSMPKDFTGRIDAAVRNMFCMLDLYKETDLLLGYLPVHEEIDTLPLLQAALDAGKRVALPYLNPKTNELQFFQMDSLNKISRGSRGLSCPPADDAQPLAEKDFFGSLCLVPGLVFDGEGNRVGYGAGYYDSFLAYYPGDKVGLVRSVQVSSNPLPHEKGDVAVDVLVTEGTIWRCRKI